MTLSGQFTLSRRARLTINSGSAMTINVASYASGASDKQISGPIPAGSPGVIATVGLDSDFDKSIFPNFCYPGLKFFVPPLVAEITLSLAHTKILTEVFDPSTSDL